MCRYYSVNADRRAACPLEKAAFLFQTPLGTICIDWACYLKAFSMITVTKRKSENMKSTTS